MLPFWCVRNVVICSIQLLHWAAVTPIFLPLSTDTTPSGWLGASFTTSSIEISSTVYTAATSRALGRVLTCMLSNRIDELWTNCISLWHSWGVILQIVNLRNRSKRMDFMGWILTGTDFQGSANKTRIIWLVFAFLRWAVGFKSSVNLSSNQ